MCDECHRNKCIPVPSWMVKSANIIEWARRYLVANPGNVGLLQRLRHSRNKAILDLRTYPSCMGIKERENTPMMFFLESAMPALSELPQITT